MLKKSISFVLIFFSLFYFCFPTHALNYDDEEVVFCLDDIDRTVEVRTPDLKLILYLELKQSFQLYSENSSVISHHIFFENCENVSMILFESFEKKIYTAEILIFEANLSNLSNAYLKKITCNDYELLIENSEEVYYESDFGKCLRSNQFKFDEKYQVIDQSPTPFSIEKNNVRVEEMTQTDSYLDAYYPTPMQNRHINYHDNIINIVPEWWFYVEGANMYFGKEYGVYVHTTKTMHGFLGYPCFKSSVTIWDFETALPFLSERNNGAGPFFNPFAGYKLSIKNAIEYSYSAFRRSDMNYETWKLHFDTSEDKIILQEEDTFHRVFLAPKNFGFAIDSDVSYNYSNKKLTFTQLEYKLSTSTNVQQQLSQLKMQTLAARSFTRLLDFFPESRKASVTTIVTALMNCAIDFATIHTEAKIENSARDLEYYANSASFKHEYAGDRDKHNISLSPTIISMNHSSYSSIFSNSVLKNYEHQYEIRFNDPEDLSDYYFSFIDYCTFDIYNSSGKVISTTTREVEYGNLGPIADNLNIEEEYFTSTSLSVNISKAGTPNIFVIKPSTTGISKLTCDNKDARIEVYDKDGDLIANTHQYDFENSCCAFLESAKRYIIRVLFHNNNQTGTGTININFIDSSYSILSNTNIPIPSSEGMCYIPMTLVNGGVYLFDTTSFNDTTIRLYDKYGNLLGESFDPFMEYSDDYSDLRACLIFCSTGIRREVIVEVSNEVKEDYELCIMYSKM